MAIDFKTKKFLIVDDFSDMRSMLKHMVSLYGATDIDMVANGKEAIKQLSKNAYDIVLCDYNLGDGMDGQQVLEESKHKGLIRFSTAFIMITAENTMEMVMGVVEYQPDEYLSKPFNKHTLKNRLEKILQKKRDLEDIENAIQKRNYDKAIQLCNKRIEESPANLSEIYKFKSDICIKIGNYDDAIAIFNTVLSGRDTPWAKLGLAKAKFYLEDYMEARDILHEMISDNENHMEAYDWLAKTLLALDDLDEAEKIYIAAVDKSPKSILRQMALGDVALKTKNFKVAEKAFKKAVNLGKDSVYKSVKNYTKQAVAMTHNGSGRVALIVLKSVRKNFKNDHEAYIHASLAENFVYMDMGKEKEAKIALDEATELYQSLTGVNDDSDLMMDMAKACILNGEKDQGMDMIRSLIMNHHEEKDILNEIQEFFNDADMGSEGKELISNIRDEIINLNNKGVQLAEDGKIEEAISYFEKAVKEMPENITINLNAAKVLLMHIKLHGKDDRYLYQVRYYLERVHKVDPANSSFQQLFNLYESMKKKASA